MRRSSLFFVFLFSASFLFAVAGEQYSLAKFPDYLSVRSEFMATLVTAPSSQALAFSAAYRNTVHGRLRISAERAGQEFYVLFQYERDGEYPLAARGNIIIRRDIATGYIKSIKWFLSDDGMSWLYLTPHNEITYIDYIIAGSVINNRQAVPIILYHFLTNNFTFLHNNTRNVLDWRLVFGSPGDGKAEGFARSLSNIRPGNMARLFFDLLDNFTIVHEYMLFSGFPGQAPEEIVKSLSSRIAHPANDRDNATVKQLKTSSIGLGSLFATIIAETASGDAVWLAILDSTEMPKCLGIVAGRDENGFYSIWAWDSGHYGQIDWVSLVKSAPDTPLTLFRLPVPAS